MANYIFSKHALEKIEERGIPMQVVLAVIDNMEILLLKEKW